MVVEVVFVDYIADGVEVGLEGVVVVEVVATDYDVGGAADVSVYEETFSPVFVDAVVDEGDVFDAFAHDA